MRTERTLVLLPGMDGSGMLFQPLLAALGKTIHTQVVTLPALGPQDYPALRGHALGQLPGDGPIDLLGESFSGPLAVLLAATLPERVRTLTLCCSFVQAPRPNLAQALARMAFIPPRWLPLAPVLPWLLGTNRPAGLDAALRAALMPLAAEVLRARLRAVAKIDVRDAVRTIRVPILALWARYDRIVPAAARESLASLRPATQHVFLPGPHGLLQTQPVAAAAVILKFLRES